MEEIILNAYERTTHPKTFMKNGFIEGVIYGDNNEAAASVRFEELPLKKAISKHGSGAKVWINYRGDKKFGLIKEIQKDPLSAKMIHVDVQLVPENLEVKMQLPIIFKGEEGLTEKKLQLHVYKPDIDVFGKIALIPEAVFIDVSEKELGYTATIRDFNLDKQIRIIDKENEIYAAITQ
jgi:large subunit ribosomal protein L25